MPGKGLPAAAALIAIALACLAITRKLDRERRLLAKLRRRGALSPGITAIPLDDLSEDERDAAGSLSAAGVLEIREKRVFIRTTTLGAFRRKRARLLLMGGFGAFLLACLVAMLILRR
ncbi:MAG TPA: hypothetical protein VHB68_03685 [Steroidobacteraceae bacterium]|nr:hypothetical protein [Steroidobacteraceae bacterium]